MSKGSRSGPSPTTQTVSTSFSDRASNNHNNNHTYGGNHPDEGYGNNRQDNYRDSAAHREWENNNGPKGYAEGPNKGGPNMHHGPPGNNMNSKGQNSYPSDPNNMKGQHQKGMYESHQKGASYSSVMSPGGDYHNSSKGRHGPEISHNNYGPQKGAVLGGNPNPASPGGYYDSRNQSHGPPNVKGQHPQYDNYRDERSGRESQHGPPQAGGKDRYHPSNMGPQNGGNQKGYPSGPGGKEGPGGQYPNQHHQQYSHSVPPSQKGGKESSYPLDYGPPARDSKGGSSKDVNYKGGPPHGGKNSMYPGSPGTGGYHNNGSEQQRGRKGPSGPNNTMGQSSKGNNFNSTSGSSGSNFNSTGGSKSEWSAPKSDWTFERQVHKTFIEFPVLDVKHPPAPKLNKQKSANSSSSGSGTNVTKENGSVVDSSGIDIGTVSGICSPVSSKESKEDVSESNNVAIKAVEEVATTKPAAENVVAAEEPVSSKPEKKKKNSNTDNTAKDTAEKTAEKKKKKRKKNSRKQSSNELSGADGENGKKSNTSENSQSQDSEASNSSGPLSSLVASPESSNTSSVDKSNSAVGATVNKKKEDEDAGTKEQETAFTMDIMEVDNRECDASPVPVSKRSGSKENAVTEEARESKESLNGWHRKSWQESANEWNIDNNDWTNQHYPPEKHQDGSKVTTAPEENSIETSEESSKDLSKTTVELHSYEEGDWNNLSASRKGSVSYENDDARGSPHGSGAGEKGGFLLGKGMKGSAKVTFIDLNRCVSPYIKISIACPYF